MLGSLLVNVPGAVLQDGMEKVAKHLDKARGKEKREERDKHNQDERAEEGNSSVPQW